MIGDVKSAAHPPTETEGALNELFVFNGRQLEPVRSTSEEVLRNILPSTVPVNDPARAISQTKETCVPDPPGESDIRCAA